MGIDFLVHYDLLHPWTASMCFPACLFLTIFEKLSTDGLSDNVNFYLTIVTNGTVDTVVPSPLHIYLTS